MAAIALLVVAVGVSLVLLLALSRASMWRDKASRLDQHCRTVRIALRLDHDELRKPALQRAAARRFFEPVAQHSWSDFKMCASRAIDVEARSDCLMNDDFPCLAAMALAAVEAIPEQ